ncbi:hypothetical protein [Sphingomonas sp. PP-CE-3G-477]|uniref:hypothetical protein n=1 Tax=Sphingomonas sp. PP-CE-3G-477 TaxID=2135660 RepID=UPI0011B2809B|nr:hypothetical protein [Sphingomonas sp. PP-CE-3G-477]
MLLAMKDTPAMKVFLLCTIALTACGSTKDRPDVDLPTKAASPDAASSRPGKDTIRALAVASKNLPTKYVKALSCDFDEKPTSAVQSYHKTAAGRAERARDVTLLKSLGFTREGRDGDLESVGGKITAPSGLTVLGLPTESAELNGMIGDANAMYVTVFGNGVTVKQVVKAARLQADFESYKKYKIRHYSKRVAGNPSTQLYLDDRGGDNVTLVCQINGTPD